MCETKNTGNGKRVFLGTLPKEEKKKDTYKGMSYDEFIEVVEKHGFKKGYEEEFYVMPHPAVKYEDKESKEIILYNENDALIIYAIFSNSNKLLKACCYGEFCHDGKSKFDILLNGLLIVGDHFSNKDKWYMEFSIDATEGFFQYFDNTIKSNYEICKEWTRFHGHSMISLLYFVNSAEEESVENSHSRYTKIEEIVKKKIEASDPKISAIIYGD